MEHIARILAFAGYRTVTGADAVRAAIAAESDGSIEKRCSGYRVFPDGTRCDGCQDCKATEILEMALEGGKT